MSTRKATIFFTQTSAKEKIDTNVTTWGELKKLITGNTSNKNFVLKQGSHTLQSPEAVLPEGDFVIFAYPQESKGGAKKAKKSAKKTAKKAAKKAVKKTAKKVAKKAGSKAKVKTVKGAAVASVVDSVKAAKSTEISDADETRLLQEEAARLGKNIPGIIR